MMNRRTFLKASAAGLVALIGGGAALYSQVPVIPKRPNPDLEDAAGWISYHDGLYRLVLPRIEMGQNIATAMKQIACTELGTPWEDVVLELHDTARPGLKPTVGSESVQLFSEPLAQACAALREAIKNGRLVGEVVVEARPRDQLRITRARGLIGARPEVEQGRAIVTGCPLYAADMSRPGQLYGRVLRAPASMEIASRPLRWNSAAAEDIPGFVRIVEEVGPPVGQSQGLGILASRPGALDLIAEALDVEWEIDGPHDRADIQGALDVDQHLAKGDLPHLAMAGEPDTGAFDVDLRIEIPLAAHAAIEPRAAVAEWDGEALTLWAGNQDVFYVRDYLAHAFSLKASQVRVQSCRVGGAFGGKVLCTVEAEAAALALAAKKPVKVQWTRAQEFALSFHRPPSSHRVQVRLAGDRVTDWSHNQVSSHIMFTSAALPAWMQRGTDFIVGDGGVERGMVVPYQLGRARADYQAVRLPVHTGPWRGLGAGTNGLATESAIDEAARRAGADPLAFRLAHIDDPRLAGVLRDVGAQSQWDGSDQSFTRGDRRVGRGVACGIYKGVSYAATVAEVEVLPDGAVRVTRLWCSHDCGLVINPDQVRAQCEGNLVWSLGMVLFDALPVEEGRVTAETFLDAPIPRISDMPEVSVRLLHTDAPPTGAGETVIVSGPGAIANAVRAATGLRPVRFPLVPETFSAESASAASVEPS
ncbi:xanthine dehydrogenase family protein molybdopterin-binding subunit [Labrenzia sp. VG12]|uniref:xanthine dehydrogenase family protein molybdopterin-binding subunit n=1 Tax=Labrenzia sp. VG12 TaxID=2021862 RepID=UPI001AD94891|nr:molybdopterin cofactor-binding domain-containing protein [Labrenzia sp. VG12]